MQEIVAEALPDVEPEPPPPPPAPEPPRPLPARAGRPLSPGVMPVAPPRALRLPGSEDATVIDDSSDSQKRRAQERRDAQRGADLAVVSFGAVDAFGAVRADVAFGGASSCSGRAPVSRAAAQVRGTPGDGRHAQQERGAPRTAAAGQRAIGRPAHLRPPWRRPRAVRRPAKTLAIPWKIAEVEPSAPSVQWRRAPKTLPPNEREPGGGIDRIHAPSASGLSSARRFRTSSCTSWIVR